MPPLAQLLLILDSSLASSSSSSSTSSKAGALDMNRNSESSSEKKIKDRRARSKSMSLMPAAAAAAESSSGNTKNPLFEESEVVFRPERSSSGGCQPIRGPLSLISCLLSCRNGNRRHKSPEEKAWEKRRAAALVELSKQQQAALADKQDTIDMLEWQLEQLQAMAGREHELQELERTTSTAAATSVQTPPATPPRLSPQKQQRSEQDEQQQVGTPAIGVGDMVLLFEMAVIRARLSIRYFCNVFIKQMEASGHPVCRTLADMEADTTFMRKEHTAFVLDSRINKAFFHCFENDSFDDSGLMRILDPAKRCVVRLDEYKRMKLLNVSEAVSNSSPSFEPDFLKFCQAKTRDMWALFDMNMNFKSLEEREAFTAAFLDMAKAVWLLHRLAFAMNPAVVIIRVGKGMDVNPTYVEPVAVPDQACSKCSSSSLAKVEFMIMPGFRAHKKVIKCQVYPHLLCK